MAEQYPHAVAVPWVRLARGLGVSLMVFSGWLAFFGLPSSLTAWLCLLSYGSIQLLLTVVGFGLVAFSSSQHLRDFVLHPFLPDNATLKKRAAKMSEELSEFLQERESLAPDTFQMLAFSDADIAAALDLDEAEITEDQRGAYYTQRQHVYHSAWVAHKNETLAEYDRRFTQRVIVLHENLKLRGYEDAKLDGYVEGIPQMPVLIRKIAERLAVAAERLPSR